MFRTLSLLSKNVAIAESSSFILKTGTKADRNDIIEFMKKNFMNQESLTRMYPMKPDRWVRCAIQVIDRSLLHPISFILRDKTTNEITSVGLNSIWTKPDPNDPKRNEYFEFDIDETDERQVAVEEISNKLHDKFFKLKPELDKVILIEMIAVASGYKRKGQFVELVECAEDILLKKKYGVQAIVAQATSVATQRAGEKLNYTFVTEEKLADYKDKNGNQLLVSDDGMTSVKLIYKTFDQKKE